jgi:hypothetical protein
MSGVCELVAMSEERDEVDRILDDFDLGGEAIESGEDTGGEQSNSAGESASTTSRLGQLHEAGVITDEEYEVLRRHVSEDDTGSSKPAEFGQPLITSEGADMDFSIVGVFTDVDTSKLTDFAFGDNDNGGPGRTVVCWQIHNHSADEIMLKHKHIEYIGQNQISYRRDENPLQVDHFGPGWRMENWEYITTDTRIQYITSIEIPNRVDQIKIDGYCSDVHSIDITDGVFFPQSELPVKIDL